MTWSDDPKRTRTFRCRDVLWDAFLRFAEEESVSVDELINTSMERYATPRAERTPIPVGVLLPDDVPLGLRGRAPLPSQTPLPAAVGSPLPMPSAGSPIPMPAGGSPIPMPTGGRPTPMPSASAPPPVPPAKPSTKSSAPGQMADTSPTPIPGGDQAPTDRPPGPALPIPPAPPSSTGVPMPLVRRTKAGTLGTQAPSFDAVTPQPGAVSSPTVPAGPPSTASAGPATRSGPPPLPHARPRPETHSGPPPLPTSALPRLVVVYNGSEYIVSKDRFIIGRGAKTTDLTIKDPNISRQHAMVEKTAAGFFIVDMGSVNGIEHKGQPIERKAIEDGDTFAICGHPFSFTYR